jgi:hypothetical protein
VVVRVRSRLGERRYSILSNNCEHSCASALRDERRSSQVERLRATPGALWRAISSQYERIANTIVQSLGLVPSGGMT